MITQNDKNNATLLHLIAFAKYLIPFAGIIVPLIIWQSKKEESEFLDLHGKRVINFHLSTMLYGIIFLTIMGIAFFGSIIELIQLENSNIDFIPVKLITVLIIGFTLIGLYSIFEFILIILGSVRANEGKEYKYPLTINFIK